MTPWDPNEIVDGTAEAAFVSDEKGQIVGWNESARRLLGLTAEEVRGKPCHEILCGLDSFGNQYCDKDCAITRMAARGEPSRQFFLEARHATGHRLPLRLVVVRLPGSKREHFFQLHVLLPSRPADGSLWGHSEGRADSPARSISAPDELDEKMRSLTPREVEVLRLLSTGNASQDIANELFISLTTVRTHTQNILRKLDVHSQIEAVALAFRKGLF